MEKENKRWLSAIVVLACFTGMLHEGVYHPVYHTKAVDAGTKAATGYDHTDYDMTFWYTDDAFAGYFLNCAKSYYEKTGVAVEIKEVDSVGFLESVYQTSMEENKYPDVYMIQNDSLGKAYLYGLAAENKDADAFCDEFSSNAVTASSCGDNMYGYPLSFSTSVLVYHAGAFAQTPESIASILAMAENSDVGIEAGNLIEWNLSDEYNDYPFVGSCFSFDTSDEEKLVVNCDINNYEKALGVFQGLSDTIDMNTETMTRQQVIDDFNSGATLAAIIDSKDLCKIGAQDFGVIQVPAINDEIGSASLSYTDMLLVNPFSNEENLASDFAAYITMECTKELTKETGYVSLKKEDTRDAAADVLYSAYENAVPVPNTMDTEDFLTELRNKMIDVWNGGAL